MRSSRTLGIRIFRGFASLAYLTGGLLFSVILFPAPGLSADRGHQDIWLRNELGERITAADNRTDPYSPKRSCGTCHGYTTITQGYHFQMGFDEAGDRYDKKRPWILSSGMYGGWLPYSAAGRLAAKSNQAPAAIDLAAYDWIGGGKLNPAKKIKISACGWCHPGGGPLEFGRTAEGRADLSRNLIQAEAGGRIPLDGDFSSSATPDGLSHFRESGVVEADCLICHLPGYRMEARNGQLAARNYRWAATAGAGIGGVRGAVFTHADPNAGPGDARVSAGSWNFATRPLVTYAWNDRKLFTEEGKLRGDIIRRAVDARNCLQCHGEPDGKNTGGIYAAQHDVHAKAGLSCTDCHPLVGKTAEERLRHQIAKGSYPQVNVRNDLDGVGMKSCIGCHKEGQYRPTRAGMPKTAPDPERRHAEKFPGMVFHTSFITCTACHATTRPARGMALLDLSAGQEQGFTAEGFATVTWVGDYEQAKAPWKPWIARAQGGRGYGEAYLPHLPKRIQWFGERMPNGEVRPIPLHQVQRAFRGLKGSPFIEPVRTDGTKVKTPSVLADGDILRMIAALTAQGFRKVVFLSDRLYEAVDGKLVAGRNPIAADSYPVVHGVVSLERKAALGQKGKPGGCLDCHGREASFFMKLQVVNIREYLRKYPELKAPQALPEMNEWGITRVPPMQ
ncbi:MAG: cytochrome c3 family protein [Deltaproteobacteria bacterium]|nr:cytochrome c3 family protein [Deltaproteobacteria bacterium]